jgi:hypothetical protein
MLKGGMQRIQDGLRGHEVHVRDPEREDILRILGPLDGIGGTTIDDGIEVVRHCALRKFPGVYNRRAKNEKQPRTIRLLFKEEENKL